MTINQILPVVFPVYKQHALNGGRKWVDDELNAATANGRIVFRPLGVVVEENLEVAPGQIIQVQYPINQLRIPMVWSADDERGTDTQEVELIKAMIENLMHVHDDLMLEKLHGCRLVVSETYHYDLSEVFPIEGQEGAYYANLITAFAQLPLEWRRA